MMVPEHDHEGIMRMNAEDHAAAAGRMKWLSAAEAPHMERCRRDLLGAMGAGATLAFGGTKPVYRRLSPGCTLCGSGSWSCLFINNLCNARCFFCPTTQDSRDEPGTSTLIFPDPAEYTDYLHRFGFQGASISGGEPLLTFEKTLSFITAIKSRFGDSLYLWMYTNGTLLTGEKARRLADAGLDEIRLNIAATGYDVRPLRLASGAVPCVTVEIPAVPEDVGIMKSRLKELEDTGVSYLNLHQIRCTAHNREHLADRGYTFLHGPQIGILESELAALGLMNHARENGVDLGINYCSLIFRHRYQARASRQRWAHLMAKHFEGVTHAGLIRSLRIHADAGTIAGIEGRLLSRAVDPQRWSISTDGNRMTLDAALLGKVVDTPHRVSVSYSLATIRPAVTYRNTFREVTLASGRRIVLERGPVSPDMELDRGEVALFMQGFLGTDQADMDAFYRRVAAESGASGARQRTWQRIIQAESLRSGLLEYY